MTLTTRQEKILKYIIDNYIATAQAVSSSELTLGFNDEFSSATFRSEMAFLEKCNLIEKMHTSSGRVPTINGYKYYEEKIINPNVSLELKNKLKAILAKRFCSIETIIDESVSIINESLRLPSIVTTSLPNESLKRIDLIPLSDKMAIILVVTSSGSVAKNTIAFDKQKIINDLSICIRIFNDRLINTPLHEIEAKLEVIKPILQSQVENYEFYIQELLNGILNIDKIAKKTSVTGTRFLTSHHEFHDVKKMQEAITMLEDSNIWQQIDYILHESGKTTITYGQDVGFNNISIASTLINSSENEHQISIIGPNRMDYAKAKWLLDFLKKEIEEKYNDKTKEN